MKKILELFLTFMKIGGFTFGGGYAMIPLIQREVVHNKKWIKEGDILEIVAIAESTPGPIAINAATFVGYKVAGFAGAIAATVGVVFPSFLIILIISYVLKEFESFKGVQYAFNGIRAGVLALIIKALFNMYKQCPKNLYAYIIMGTSFILAAFLHVSVLIVIIACALFGLVTYLVDKRRAK
ncbi:chromate transporter [Butyrivibrio hungatei]|uniref:Chromate transporter n=1 Tax=Butyrivibrio hungatei TaxID=185008 RepID=A0A1D9P565_9FIRM|nr:chromate transporter [Butyrivibrio hungatei]AOZ97623.1 chromate transporter [Butyrivibrio hungatei]